MSLISCFTFSPNCTRSSATSISVKILFWFKFFEQSFPIFLLRRQWWLDAIISAYTTNYDYAITPHHTCFAAIIEPLLRKISGTNSFEMGNDSWGKQLIDALPMADNASIIRKFPNKRECVAVCLRRRRRQLIVNNVIFDAKCLMHINGAETSASTTCKTLYLLKFIQMVRHYRHQPNIYEQGND